MCNLNGAIEEHGMQQGEEIKLIELICRKVKKGKALPVIAEELEEEITVVSPIYDTVLESTPDYNCGEIYALLHSGNE